MASVQPDRQADPVELAKHFIAGQDLDMAVAFALANTLRQRTSFGLARKVLKRLWDDYDALPRDPALHVRVRQRYALCTYKDPDLDPETKYDQAIDILRTGIDLDKSGDQEDLGLAGAIWKRKWEATTSIIYLERSHYFYERGHKLGMQTPGYDGYTGINAAFVLDQIAFQESEAALHGTHVFSTQRRERATRIREELVTLLQGHAQVGTSWWVTVTLAEALLGLDRFEEATEVLGRARGLIDDTAGSEHAIPEWEQESTARQLVRLVLIRSGSSQLANLDLDQPRWRGIRQLVPNEHALRGIIIGKVGLALSGGGFRASLFHIGVLARLAELDVLRHVDSISCVSGGSIIGAHYYLKLKQVLESTADGDIDRDHYVRLVRETATEFLAGVQENIRMRLFSNIFGNFRMLLDPGSPPTVRLGELYERRIYAKAFGGKARELYMNDLMVSPHGEDPGFAPKRRNWRRGSKVPMLILNATSLNTGHNWHFTATYMGESPNAISRSIDANYRLRRLYYADAPAAHRRIRLGHAVAASSCVPGLFQPLVIDNLYVKPARLDDHVPPRDRKISVRLVDGGVYDNQGTAALLEQGCDTLLVSDASGQSESVDEPALSMLGVPLRTMSLLQQRIRVAQFQELAARSRATLLRNLMFVHLKQDLEGSDIDWIECREPSRPRGNRPETTYGIDRKVQERLADVRTDLDSFSEIEAYALMASGYRMTSQSCPQGISAPAMEDAPEWPFLDNEFYPHLRASSARQAEICRQLDASSQIPFKIWRLSRPLQLTAWILGAALLLLLGVLAWEYRESGIRITVAWATSFLLFLVLGALAGPLATKLANYRKTLSQTLWLALLACGGTLLVWLHIQVFDRLFLWQGRLRALLRIPASG